MRDSLRYALRAVLAAPVLSLALVLSLGIGVGANAAVFNFISALLLRAPAGLDESGLAIVRSTQTPDGVAGPVTPTELAALQAARTFDAVAGYDDSTVTGATLGGTSRRVRIAAVTSTFFQTLGLDPASGRLLTHADSAAVVISHRLWEAFGSRDDVLETTLTIDGQALAIAGIAPPRFNGLHPGRSTDVWRLLDEPVTDTAREARHLDVIARTADVDRAAARLAGRFTVVPYSFMEPALRGQTTLLAVVLSGATLLVLISACVNAASLLLSRGNARRSDFAVKLALGASRASLTRQLLLESAIIGIAGGGAGVLLAHYTTKIIPSLFAPEHAEMLNAHLSPGIIVTTIAVSTILGMALGLLPAIRGTAPVTALDLRGDAGRISETGPGSRLQAGLVVTQIAVSTVLLVSSLLLNRSLSQALAGDEGAGAATVVVATLSEPPFRFDPVRGQRDFADLQQVAFEMPGIARAGLVATLPLGRTTRVVFDIETKPGVIEHAETDINVVSPTFFETMQMPLIEGRSFSAADAGRSPAVAIINDEAMRQYFGDSAIGRFVTDRRGDRIQIVGVVRVGRYRTMQEVPGPMVYRPIGQEYLPRMQLVIRTFEPPTGDLFRRLGPALKGRYVELHRLATLDQHLSEALVLDRFVTTLVSACGLMALALAIAGVYSLMLDSVQRRTREIGLRLALGASALRVARSTFAFGLGLAGIGVVVGAAVTFAIDRAARQFVSGLPAIDPASIAIAIAVLAGVVTLAAIVPMRRALRVSPTVALRHT